MEVNLDLVKRNLAISLVLKDKGVYDQSYLLWRDRFPSSGGDSGGRQDIFQLTMAFDLDNEVEFTLWGMTKEEFTDYLLTNLPDTRSRLKDTGMTILVDGGYTHLIDLGDCRDIYLGWGG